MLKGDEPGQIGDIGSKGETGDTGPTGPTGDKGISKIKNINILLRKIPVKLNILYNNLCGIF